MRFSPFVYKDFLISTIVDNSNSTNYNTNIISSNSYTFSNLIIE